MAAAEILALAQEIAAAPVGDLTFMEVCGTHSHAAARAGLHQLLPKRVRLVSGPGCPVCVTPKALVDYAIALARLDGVTVATFGDMMRVPGSVSSLLEQRARGGEVVVVYSPMDALQLAGERADKQVVFLGVGFETTAPGVARTAIGAAEQAVPNFTLVSSHKLIPPAMAAIMEAKEVRIDGFLAPGHVSTVIGMRAYQPLVDTHRVPCAITGFEPVEIMRGVAALVRQHARGEARVENCYSQVVRDQGNPAARAMIDEVFAIEQSEWRGLGWIPASGLRLRPEFAHLDALARFPLDLPPPTEDEGCMCGEVLRGVITPPECPLFGQACTPDHPVGPCMVSSEGACAAAYRYGCVSA